MQETRGRRPKAGSEREEEWSEYLGRHSEGSGERSTDAGR